MVDDPRTLVSTGWLAQRLGQPRLRILDGSWYLPAMARDPQAEFAAGHIPGASFFDIDAIADRTSSLPHMAPAAAEFERAVGALGIGDGDQVVVYDGAGIFSAPRVWWLFRLMGIDTVAVLDGGLPKWRAEGHPVALGTPETLVRELHARPAPARVRDADAVAAAAQEGVPQLLDARPAARFRGEAPEPRPGLRAGHVPGALSLPWNELIQADGTMKPLPQLQAAFVAAGVDLARPVITCCGSGVSAAVLSLGLERLGQHAHALYDGSWADWGRPGDRPIEIGPARGRHVQEA